VSSMDEAEKNELTQTDKLATLVYSLKSMLRAIGGTWVETWIAEAVEAAKKGKVVRYDK